MRAVIDGTFPRVSTDVLIGCTAAGGAAYDKVTETLHHLGLAGILVLEACDGTTPIGERVAEWAGAAGLDPVDLEATVRTHVDELVARGLCTRTTNAESRPVRSGSCASDHGAHRGVVHGVLDHGIAFCSDDAALIERVDTYLGSGDPGREPDTLFDLVPDAAGGVLLRTDDDWDFPSADQLLRQVCGVMNEYASRTRTMAALHAAGLRTPDGDVVLVSGPPDAGKTTLAAGLVAAGWDYLGDESVGLAPGTLDAVGYPKPLTLSATSRRALGIDERAVWPDVGPETIRGDVVRCHGRVGPIVGMVFVRYDPGAPSDVTLEPLTGTDALDAVCSATLNLGGIDALDFQTLCDLADTVPVTRLIHRDVVAAVPAVNPPWHPGVWSGP